MRHDWYRPKVSGEQREYLNVAKGSAESLLRLLNELLDLSRIEAGKMELDHRPFALLDLLEEVRAVFLPDLRGRPVQMRIEIEPGIPPRLSGDPARLRQVLLNLAGNAVKFTESGAIAIHVERRPDAADSMLHFRVIDSGRGIPPEKLEAVFQSFVQVDGGNRRRKGGAGLGLAIARGLAEQMGGYLWAENNPDRGCTFHFMVMLEEAPESSETDEPSARASMPGVPLRILVAEDNIVNQRLMLRLLEKDGHAVTLAANGLEAVQAVEQGDFDVILMDVQMPELDGLEATLEIRRIESGREGKTTIIALTAGAMKSDKEDCLAAGMDDYLTKPIRHEELREILSRIGPRRLAQSAAACPESGGRLSESN